MDVPSRCKQKDKVGEFQKKQLVNVMKKLLDLCTERERERSFYIAEVAGGSQYELMRKK